ncbi:MAG: hypothetical protein FWE94_07995, partial [Coriobacteriia bacterium]|nr:hypothetical protein [Coriobacteriia bacterium]
MDQTFRKAAGTRRRARLSVLLCLALVLGALPGTAWAGGALDGGAPALAASGGTSLSAIGFVGWQDVSGGNYHSLALKEDGSLWAWGRNDYGQLGIGSTISTSTPVRIGTGTDWKAVSAGFSHSLALKGDGSLWAWGLNDYGQLGDGTITDKSAPVQVGTGTDWKAVSAGQYHSLALKGDGSLWAWGNNYYGQLGDGTSGSSTNTSTPAQVGSVTDWKAVSAGMNHSLALKTDGTLWAWGYNGSGQLGIGSTISTSTPVRIGTGTDWAALGAKGANSLALKTDGSLWAWGYNGFGQLGIGSAVGTSTPVQVGSATDWQAVSAAYHSLAIKDDGSLWAWGRNADGRLGIGTSGDSTNKSAPVPVEGDIGWKAVSAGQYHSLGIKEDGSLWAWGYNYYGQLGDGTSGSGANKNVPTLIDGPAPDGTPPESSTDATSSYTGTATITITATDPAGAGEAASGVKEVTYMLDDDAPVVVPGDEAVVV